MAATSLVITSQEMRAAIITGCLFPDLPVAGNPWRCRRTLTSVGRVAVLLSSGGPP
jgi:hypothetical protein